jgi:DNA-binding transcriptional MerR regulator
MTATGAAADSREPAVALLSIGEVLNLLRPEFVDVTISKLRFLEAEGLVDPLRTPAGYRKYTPAHVARLRLVLAAQRDRYLPLRVIREQLEAAERGEKVVGLFAADSPPAAPRPSGPSPVIPSPVIPSPGALSLETPSPVIQSSGGRGELGEARLTRAQLQERAGIDDAGMADLEQYGLLAPGPNGYYGPDALTVARIAARLAEYGLEGRHLRPYRGTADREVGLLSQLVLPLTKQAGPNGRAQALETVHELAALCSQLHGALVRQGLRAVLDT